MWWNEFWDGIWVKEGIRRFKGVLWGKLVGLEGFCGVNVSV